MAALTAKQAAFVEEYLIDLNATRAAIRAGYSERTAPAQGSRLLKNVKVVTSIVAKQAERSKRVQMDGDRVLQELARIGYADIRRLFTWDEERAAFIPSSDLSDDDAAAISEIQAETIRTENDDGVIETRIKLKLKTYDKLEALAKLGQHLGLFTDRHVNIDPSTLSDEELRRIAAGEDPIRVLADTRGGAA